MEYGSGRDGRRWSEVGGGGRILFISYDHGKGRPYCDDFIYSTNPVEGSGFRGPVTVPQLSGPVPRRSVCLRLVPSPRGPTEDLWGEEKILFGVVYG